MAALREFVAENRRHNPKAEIFFGDRTPHAEVPARVREIQNALSQLPESELVYPENFIPLPIELLQAVHDPSYIEFVLRSKGLPGNGYRYPSSFAYRRANHISPHKIGQQGYYSFDMYTPINRFTGQAALLSATAAHNAALAVANGQRAAYALNRPPGHHAGFDYMGGYCYFNNAAVAAQTLVEQGTVGIIDVDFHHGNGTEDIVRKTQATLSYPQMFYVSIHAHPDRKFPYGSGAKNFMTADGQVLSLNYPLGRGVKDQQYNRVLDRALQAVEKLNPKFLVVSIGYDTHEADPICDFGLTTAYYEVMSCSLMGLNLPTVFVQEGGYNVEAIGANAASFVKGILHSL